MPNPSAMSVAIMRSPEMISSVGRNGRVTCRSPDGSTTSACASTHPTFGLGRQEIDAA